MATATIGLTAKLQVNTGGGFVDLADITEIEFPGDEVNTIKSTTLGSSGASHTYIPGMRDPKALNFSANYAAATYTALRALLAVAWPYKITSDTTNNQTFSFTGILTKADVKLMPDDISKLSCSIQPSGQITVA